MTETRQVGYCTNVHAGATLQQTRDNLLQHAGEVRRLYAPDGTMGIGLWLSAATARELIAQRGAGEFSAWLRDQGLIPFTLNGFPYGDFHQAVVKHDVYQPTWYHADRLRYTEDLVQLLHQLLPDNCEGSISTLPLAWPQPPASDRETQAAVAALRRLAGQLAALESEHGRLIYLCLEPEPGCRLQRSEDVVEWFEHHLLPGGNESQLRRYIRVCHDICHAAVMFESQREVFERFAAAGVLVGKVQVSAGIRVRFDALPEADRVRAIEQLRSFAEDRYLHQTVIRESSGRQRFVEDLPLALSEVADPRRLTSQWRIHFHVPVYLQGFGFLETTQDDIDACLAACVGNQQLTHFEVETYAWGVLPAELQQSSLAAGIADELRWVSARGRG